MLEIDLPEHAHMVRKVAKQVAERRIGPLVAAVDARGEFSTEILAILRDAGWLSMCVPSDHGGVDTDTTSLCVIMEELSRVFPTASTMLTPHWFAVKMIARWTSAAWASSLFERINDGTALGALAATEPDAGSDLGSATTRAAPSQDGWKIDGAKRFITNGGHADFYVVVARTGEPGSRGISLFMVEADRRGVSIGRLERKMGLRASATAEVYFDDVQIPEDHLLGVKDHGFSQMKEALIEGRVLVAAISSGIAASALDHATSYASQRKQFGAAIASFQGIQFLLADMAIQVCAARSMTYDAARALDLGLPQSAYLASVAKTAASDAAMAVTTDAVQVLGGAGYTADYPAEMLMRDAKIQQIYEGTNQVQRILIARSLLDGAARQ